MWSKNKKPMTASERKWVGMVREGPCSCCGEPVPCEAHEIEQGSWFTAIAWCPACHRDSFSGWHGQKQAFTLRKLDEVKCLNKTIARIFEQIGG